MWILVSISDHWICPGPEEIPDGEPWQPAVLAVGILQSSSSPAQHLRWGGHRQHTASSSFTVHPALTSRPRSDDQHVKINSPQRASPGVPDQHRLEPWVTAPGHCSPLSSNKQPVLVSRKGGKLRGEQNIIIYSPRCAVPKTPSSATSRWRSPDTPHPHAARSRGSPGHHGAGEVCARRRYRSSHEAACAHAKAKRRCTRSDTDRRLAAFRSLPPPCATEDGGAPWRVAGLRLQVLHPAPCFPTHHLHHPFRLYAL